MKKFKKFFAFTAVLAVFVSFDRIGTVAAEVTCPPHGPYEDRLLDVSQGYEEHYVDYRDSDGNYYYDSNGEKVKVKCVITWSRYYRGVYCTSCWKFIYDYRYEEKPRRHSYSACQGDKE